MKLVYTHENRLLVSNVQNILSNADINLTLKNEYAGGASGDLSFLSTWPELWVVQDDDFDKAMEIINRITNEINESDWSCSQCSEQNSAAFEVCWNCQHDNV